MVSKVFMTGGAGFLGRAILRHYQERPVFHFTIYSRDEAKQARVRQQFPQHIYILGDVRDKDRLELAMAGHDIVIHAAAMKYVPEGEIHVSEAVAVNVDGSRNVCKAAIRMGIEKVVGISTDKCCRPVNVYGMTKLIMERLFQEAAGMSETQFLAVRYGNVVSSTGSVIPLFRRQAREGCVTLTNPSMTRFWLRIEDAVRLVDIAMEYTQSGHVLIPRLRSLTMAGVATAAGIVELGDRDADRQVDRKIIGQRFGEKIHEELLSPVETIYTESLKSDDPLPFGVMAMHPVTGGALISHEERPYQSDNPDEWLSTEEMCQWIREAPE